MSLRQKLLRMRVLRGGSWYDDAPDNFSAAYRNWFIPVFSDCCLGFRCILSSP